MNKQQGSLNLRPAKAYSIFAELVNLNLRNHLRDVACCSSTTMEAACPHTKHFYKIKTSNVAVTIEKSRLHIASGQC